MLVVYRDVFGGRNEGESLERAWEGQRDRAILFRTGQINPAKLVGDSKWQDRANKWTEDLAVTGMNVLGRFIEQLRGSSPSFEEYSESTSEEG